MEVAIAVTVAAKEPSWRVRLFAVEVAVAASFGDRLTMPGHYDIASPRAHAAHYCSRGLHLP